MNQPPQWITIGKIVAPSGVRGELKMALYVDDVAFLSDHDSLFLEGRPRREIKLIRARAHKGQALLQLEGITDRNMAEEYRGREVSVPYEWLPALDEDEYYVADIVGLSVDTTTGERLGAVAEVMFTGANEVYIIRGGPRGEILLPAIESVVQTVDLDGGRIVVEVPEGLLD